MFCADADGTVHGDGSALRHGQGLIDRGCCPDIARICRGGRIAGVGAVKGNQKGNATGDRVSAAGQSAVRCQHNLILTVCHGIGVGLVQIIESRAAGLKNRQGGVNEHRLDSLIAVKVQCSCCVRRQILASGHAIPAEELVARGRGSHQRIGHHRRLSLGGFCGNFHAVHRIAAVLTGQEGGGGGDIGNQCQVGDRDTGIVSGTAGFQVNLNGVSGCQFTRIAAISRDRIPRHLNGAAILGNGIVKGQGCGCGLFVGQRQRSLICGVIASAGCTNDVAGDGISAG